MISAVIHVDRLEPVSQPRPHLVQDLQRLVQTERDVQWRWHNLVQHRGVLCSTDDGHVVAAKVVLSLLLILVGLSSPSMTEHYDLFPGPLVSCLLQEPLLGETHWTRVG